MPQISVIIPVHNTIQYLVQAIESVIKQTLSDFELIIVDDGSTDGCETLVDRYRDTDERIQVIHQHQGGVSVARNTAINIARGEYIVFLDSDDYFHNDHALELILLESRQKNSDIIFYGYVDINMQTGKCRKSQVGFDSSAFVQTKADFLNYIYDKGFFPTACWQMAIKKNYIDAYGLRFPEHVVCEDIDWGVKALYNASSYSFVDECLLSYRRNRFGSIMSERGLKHLQGCMFAVRNWLAIPKDQRYLGLTNFVAHMYGFIFSYYTIIPKEDKKKAEAEFIGQDQILIESDRWNHRLIYYVLHSFGITFTAWMIRIVYMLFYAPGSAFGYLRRKLQ